MEFTQMIEVNVTYKKYNFNEQGGYVIHDVIIMEFEKHPLTPIF